jgi:hypothetical protein
MRPILVKESIYPNNLEPKCHLHWIRILNHHLLSIRARGRQSACNYARWGIHRVQLTTYHLLRRRSQHAPSYYLTQLLTSVRENLIVYMYMKGWCKAYLNSVVQFWWDLNPRSSDVGPVFSPTTPPQFELGGICPM